MKLAIRQMTKHDVPAVGAILFQSFNTVATRHGYTPRFQNPKEAVAWAWSLLRHSPVEIFIGETGNRIAGLCCLNPRGTIGGVGPVAVDPEFQRQRIGQQLMTALIGKSSGIESLRLVQEAYNPASFSLYHGLGFTPVACLLELFHPGDESLRLEFSPDVIQLAIGDIDALQAYDKPKSKSERQTDFVYYIHWGKLFAYRDRDRIRGFLACLPAPGSVTLGPLLADGEQEAMVLFEHAMATFNGKAYRTRIMARDAALIEKLMTWGFKVASINNLMVRGAWRPCSFIEGFGLFPEGI